MPGYTIEEEVYEGHYRVVAVRAGDMIVYSIDYYKRLPAIPECTEELALPQSPSRICYVDLGGGCEAAVIVSPGRVELASLRLTASADNDPAGGSLSEARRLCVERAESWLDSLEGDSAG